MVITSILIIAILRVDFPCQQPQRVRNNGVFIDENDANVKTL